jgi:hypothetical protein
MAGPSDTSDPSSPGGTGACHLADGQQVIFISSEGAMHERPDWDPITTRSVVRRVEHEPHNLNNCCDLLDLI